MDTNAPTALEPEGTQVDAAPQDTSTPTLQGSAHVRPIFLGNLEYGATTNEIEDIFLRPALDMPPMAVERVDFKRGFCFVFLKDIHSDEEKERVEKYVDGINGMSFPRVSSDIRAEFARGDGRVKRKEEDRRKEIQPNETLFVVNFSEETTKKEDLEMLFSPFGELIRVDMKRNYAFVQFSKLEDAVKAKDATNGGKLDQNVITVEYVANRRRDDGGRRDDRRRDGGRGRRDFDRRRDDRGSRRYDDRRDFDRRAPRYDRGRSRSRSPNYRHRSRSRSPRSRDHDDYRGRGGHDSYYKGRDYGLDQGREREFRGYR